MTTPATAPIDTLARAVGREAIVRLRDAGFSCGQARAGSDAAIAVVRAGACDLDTAVLAAQAATTAAYAALERSSS